MLKILDYGAGNMLSLYRAYEHLNIDYKIVINTESISGKDILIIPGVGNFSSASNRLRETGLLDIYKLSRNQRPFVIGICLGMQLLLEIGTEGGESNGLSLIPGKVKKIPQVCQEGLPIYRTLIGWENFKLSNNLDTSFEWLKKHNNKSFYHVHSFMCNLTNPKDILGTYTKNLSFIPTIVGSKEQKAIGFQFHPEKSGIEGLSLLYQTLVFAEEIY